VADPEARGDVGLRERARDAVRVGVAAEGDEQMLALRGGERLREELRALASSWRGRDGEASDGVQHEGGLWRDLRTRVESMRRS